MKKKLRGLLVGSAVVGAVVGVALVAPLLVPVSRFIPELTAIVSEKLGQPVRIGDLSFRLFPTPRARASDVVVGAKSDVRIDELDIVPQVLPLLVGERTVRLVRAKGVAVKESAFAIAGSLPQGGEAGVSLERIVLTEVTLQHSRLRLPVFSVDAQLERQVGIRRAVLEADGAMLTVLNSAQRERTADATIDGQLFGGKVNVALKADWSRQWQVSGKADIAGVDVAALQRILGKKPRLTGRLKTSATFSARAKTPAQLADALVLEGPFEILGGAYQGVDLTKAGDVTGKAAAGDATPFEQFTGKVHVRAKRVQVESLCVRSPKVVAGGRVEISPEDALSGKLDVSIAKTGGFVGVPVALSGTVDQPSVRPTTGYIVGAAIGTLVLPGIGTGIGASAAGSLEGKSDCK